MKIIVSGISVDYPQGEEITEVIDSERSFSIDRDPRFSYVEVTIGGSTGSLVKFSEKVRIRKKGFKIDFI